MTTAISVAVLAELVVQEERGHGVHDDGRDGADGRAGYQVTPFEGKVEQQPGGEEEEPELQHH